MENSIIVSFGAYSPILEDTIPGWSEFSRGIYVGSVIGIHFFALLMKCVFYKELHPWMSLKKDLYEKLKIMTIIFYGILAGGFIAAPFLLGWYFQKNYFTIAGIFILVVVSTYL